jgi:hypothetical protein
MSPSAPPYGPPEAGYGQVLPPQPEPAQPSYGPGPELIPFEPEPTSLQYQPPEEPPPYHPPPAPRRSRPLIVVAALAVLLVIVAVTVFLLNSSRSSNSPAEAVDKYFNALRHRDLSAVQNAVCVSMRDQITSDTLPGRDKDVRQVRVKINSTEEKDDTHATVLATVTTPDEGTSRFSIVTLKEGDTWRVCGAPLQTS